MAVLIFPLLVGRSTMRGKNTAGSAKGVGPRLGFRRPLAEIAPRLTITGVTRDNTGAALGNCEVELYRRNQDQTSMEFVERQVSDASGNFSFVVGIGMQYQHIAYQVGSPDKAGVSVRTLVGT